jgi:hypothetical protein
LLISNLIGKFVKILKSHVIPRIGDALISLSTISRFWSQILPALSDASTPGHPLHSHWILWLHGHLLNLTLPIYHILAKLPDVQFLVQSIVISSEYVVLSTIHLILHHNFLWSRPGSVSNSFVQTLLTSYKHVNIFKIDQIWILTYALIDSLIV